jgi:carbonic anhydrase/acetyltransferase-like protein (isoleucine patch superfamily)
MSWYASHGKRALDIVGSAALLAISLPIQLTVAAVNGRPVLFVQDRPVLDGTVFQLRKFRSMRHIHVNPNATIGHDSILESFVSINPAATVSGDVHVRSRTLIGAGAIVLQGLSIGADATVGAGAVVTRSVPDGVVVKGVPGVWS